MRRTGVVALAVGATLMAGGAVAYADGPDSSCSDCVLLAPADFDATGDDKIKQAKKPRKIKAL